MTEPQSAPNANLKLKYILGRTSLRENRLEDAVEIFLSILREAPDDPEALLTLGNIYLASADGLTAGNLFRRALANDPENLVLQGQVQLALMEQNPDLPEEPDPTDPSAIRRMLQRLTGKPVPYSEEEMFQAAQMLQEVLSSSSPAEEVANHYDEIEGLLPALLEINIRQARTDGQAEIVEGLRKLQLNIDAQRPAPAYVEKSTPTEKAQLVSRLDAKILLLLPDAARPSARMALAAESLRQLGCEVLATQQYQPGSAFQPDVVIASNPHLRPALAQSLARCSASSLPLLVDLDADFERLPIYHPEYASRGLGRIEASKAYTASLLMATQLVVPSHAMAEALRANGYAVSVIPEGWSKSNPLWQKPATLHPTLSIGWIGSTGFLEDFAMVRRMLIRVLREFANTRATIIGSPLVYQMLDTISPTSKVFLPYPSDEDYLPLLDHLDVLLVPLRLQPYHATRNDRILMEAGLKSIPWIASPIPAFQEWAVGGLIATQREEWHTHLRQLVMDAGLRRSLGSQGFLAAGKRESRQIGQYWASLIQSTLQSSSFAAASSPADAVFSSEMIQ